MEAKSNYMLVGLTVLLLGSALLSVSLWLSVGYDKKSYKTYLTYLDEPASGLTEESPVKFNGVRVGIVNSIRINRQNPEQVILVLRIEEGVPITESTVSTLVSQGITGNTYLGLMATNASLAPLKKIPDMPYPVIPSRPSFFYQLEKDVRGIAQDVRRIFSEENAKNLEKILANFETLSKTFANNEKNIDKTLQDIPKLVADLRKSADMFDTMAADVSVSGKQFTTTMKAGKVSIDQISQQTLPAITELTRRLNEIAVNLEKVSSEMRQNPAVIVRGTTPRPLGPGERP